MNDSFNPLDWIEPEPNPAPNDQSQYSHAHAQGNPSAPSRQPCSTFTGGQALPRPLTPSSISSEVDTVISRIEASLTDITTSYPDWLNVGFALANEFGESGRSFYHRVSRFYSGYTKTECDKQFDQCLKAKGHGITIKTFFHMAQQAGIDIGKEGGVSEATMYRGHTTVAAASDTSEDARTATIHRGPESPSPELPTLPDAIFPLLPEFLQRVVEVADSNEERDILLLGSLGVLSAVFPKLSGTYDGKKVFSNIYLFVTAPASAGKGRLGFCKQLIMPIHWELRKESERLKQVYDMEMREYNIAKLKDPNAEKPEKPPELMLTIPANSTATGMFQLLADNDGRGLIFETEGDTLALAFKSDHGNYSDGYRKGAHHEMISYYRRTDREYREIRYPCISTVLSGTPRQIASLIPSAENGLFSRFIFYYMNIRPVWKNVFAKRSGKGLEEHFDQLGQETFTLHKAMKEHPAMEFCLTREQEERFHVFFTQIQDKYLTFHGMDYMGTIRRMGLIAFRIAMIFTGLRIMETGDFSEKQVCLDDDFQSALATIRILIKHSSHVFSELPEETKLTRTKDKKEQYFDRLPERFSHAEFIAIAKSMDIPERTAVRYIATFCDKGLLLREHQGSYVNVSIIPPVGDNH